MKYMNLKCRETYTHFLRGDGGNHLWSLKMDGGCQKVGEDLLAAKSHIILRTLLDCEMFAEAVKLVHLLF